MQRISWYITQALAYPGAMIATPIVAAIMLVAIGGGALDDAIVGVPGKSVSTAPLLEMNTAAISDSLTRWWKGTLIQTKRVKVVSNEINPTRAGSRKVLRKPSKFELAFEQLEMHVRKERQKRLAAQAAASLSVKPVDKQSSRTSPPASSPRVIGTRRRRSRGGAYDMEMQSF
jgi:hypothetical protein